MRPYLNEEFILKIYKVFLNKGAMKLYFVLRSQMIRLRISDTSTMFDFHDANDRQYFE
jgi:hypothetical protein